MLDLTKLTHFALASGANADIPAADPDVELTLVVFGPERMTLTLIDTGDREIGVGEVDFMITTKIRVANIKTIRLTAGPGGGDFYVIADQEVIRN